MCKDEECRILWVYRVHAPKVYSTQGTPSPTSQSDISKAHCNQLTTPTDETIASPWSLRIMQQHVVRPIPILPRVALPNLSFTATCATHSTQRRIIHRAAKISVSGWTDRQERATSATTGWWVCDPAREGWLDSFAFAQCSVGRTRASRFTVLYVCICERMRRRKIFELKCIFLLQLESDGCELLVVVVCGL